jgi:hypothetical protein
MEQSRRIAGESTYQPEAQVVTIAALAPEKEMPGAAMQANRCGEDNIAVEQEQVGYSGKKRRLETVEEVEIQLAVILKQLETYFDRQVHSNDVEALGFSLHQLFRCIDLLYQKALPTLEASAGEHQASAGSDLLQRQQIWLQAHAINRTLDRMAPLCHLLNDVIESLLDTLENEDRWLRSCDEEDTLLLEKVDASQAESRYDIPETGSAGIESDAWEQAISHLMDRLLIWQEQHHNLKPFQQQFTYSLPTENGLSELDKAFAVLLDSAEAIFGDILLSFRTVVPEDCEEVSALLFDMMQQSDQMLVQFAIILEPLTRLIRHFAVIGENG